jgi:hypothetical protein
MLFDEESLRKGIRFALGSRGIWSPEIEDEMYFEIKRQALIELEHEQEKKPTYKRGLKLKFKKR